MAYYSTRLDPVAQAMSECLQAVGAAALALLLLASAPIVLHSPLTLKVPHAYMSPARQLSCMSVLLSQPHITIERCVTFTPATLGHRGQIKTMAARAYLQDMPFPKADLTIVC